jgi:hypothetical protein
MKESHRKIWSSLTPTQKDIVREFVRRVQATRPPPSPGRCEVCGEAPPKHSPWCTRG